MPEISIPLVAIQCFTFVHLCVCSRHEVDRSRARYSTAREWISSRERKESLNGIQSHTKKHHGRNIVDEPQFEEDQEIPKLIGTAGMKQLHFDYLNLFAERGMQAFSGTGKDEFLADCMRDVMHWLGHSTETTPIQRMEFCEKFWKTQNGGEVFTDEIKHMETVQTQKPCSDDKVAVDFADGVHRPCNESPTSGSTSAHYRSPTSGGDSAGGYHGNPAGGGRYETKDVDGGVTIDEVNRAVPVEGSTVHSKGSVSAVGDSDTTGHWSHGESERTYPEARGNGGSPLASADSKSNFRPIGWKSGSSCLTQPLAVFTLLVAKLHF